MIILQVSKYGLLVYQFMSLEGAKIQHVGMALSVSVSFCQFRAD